MRKRIDDVQGSHGDAFTLSISDLMAGLMSIFILTICYFILNFSQATAQLTQNDIKREELLNIIYKELEESGVKVIVDDQHGVLRIPEGVMFDVGQADVKPEGQRVIVTLGKVLEKTLKSERFNGEVETVFIEGHTDNVPISNGVFPSNWELSTKRAINTWLLMGSVAPNLQQLKNKREQLVFSCSGYADTRPIADNNTENGRRENRRIDVRFSMSPPRDEDMSIVKFVRGKLGKNE